MTTRARSKSSSPKKQITLDLPRGWDYLTTEQIEQICRLLIEAARNYTRTGVFDRHTFLVESFLYLSGLEVVGDIHVPGDDELLSGVSEGTDEEAYQTYKAKIKKSYYECRYKDEQKRRSIQTIDGREVPIRITLAEMALLTTGYKEYDNGQMKQHDGPLGWLLNPSTLTKFPYPTLSLPDRRTKGRRHMQTVEFEGPAPLMDGMKWRQYRITSDYVQYLQKIENNLLLMQQSSAKYGSERIARQRALVNEVRSSFLANLFCRRVNHIDPETGQMSDGFFYVSSQCADNAYLFDNFPEEKYQAILLWWQGMMKYLSKQYPKVFRTEKKIGNTSSEDPLKLYTRSTTTMIKYGGMSEEEVNSALQKILDGYNKSQPTYKQLSRLVVRKYPFFKNASRKIIRTEVLRDEPI